MAGEAIHNPMPTTLDKQSAQSPTQIVGKSFGVFGTRTMVFLLIVELVLLVTLATLGPVFGVYAPDLHLEQLP